MYPLVANTDDLISVLDRVLDKGIVLESWARLSLQESRQRRFQGSFRLQNFR
ncbi:MAG TPA: gas vesicle protein GvpJ [Candidatus Angelobacter sp.]